MVTLGSDCAITKRGAMSSINLGGTSYHIGQLHIYKESVIDKVKMSTMEICY